MQIHANGVIHISSVPNRLCLHVSWGKDMEEMTLVSTAINQDDVKTGRRPLMSYASSHRCCIACWAAADDDQILHIVCKHENTCAVS